MGYGVESDRDSPQSKLVTRRRHGFRAMGQEGWAFDCTRTAPVNDSLLHNAPSLSRKQ